MSNLLHYAIGTSTRGDKRATGPYLAKQRPCHAQIALNLDGQPRRPLRGLLMLSAPRPLAREYTIAYVRTPIAAFQSEMSGNRWPRRGLLAMKPYAGKSRI